MREPLAGHRQRALSFLPLEALPRQGQRRELRSNIPLTQCHVVRFAGGTRIKHERRMKIVIDTD